MLKKFLKDWMLVIAMVAGAGLYLSYRAVPVLHPAGPVLYGIVRRVQPVLLFSMLFLSFCKIEPHQMRPHRWQAWLLLVQVAAFLLTAWLSVKFPSAAIPLQAAMLCLICPTATACAVVTGKLGGNMAGVVTYTVLINLVVAVVVPLVLPLVHPIEGMRFIEAFRLILSKVFPLLILPCVCAWLVRYLFPKLHARLLSYVHLSFYIWAVALATAILMSTRAIFHSEGGASVLGWIALSSLLSCIFQFWIGKKIGARSGCRISAGQALGQKNTVFAIWMGYTFLDPVTSIAGGFYSIWHNVFNTWQLRRRSREPAR